MLRLMALANAWNESKFFERRYSLPESDVPHPVAAKPRNGEMHPVGIVDCTL